MSHTVKATLFYFLSLLVTAILYMYSFHMLEENNKISGVSLSQLEMLNKEFIILMLVISTIYLLVIGFTSGIVQQVLIKTISLVPVVKINLKQTYLP